MSTKLPRDVDQRDTRLNVRLTSAQRDLIEEAARTSNKSLTDFVLENTSAAAERVLADRRWFVISDKAWAELDAQLARPAIFKPRLSQRLNSEDPFVD